MSSLRQIQHEGRAWALDASPAPHGLGEAFTARCEPLPAVLVKFVLPADSPAEPVGLAALRVKLQSVASENVVRVTGGGVCDAQHYLTLEDTPGHSLEAWIARYRHAGRRPSPGVVQWAFDALCAGVQAGHRAGLVHRRVCARAVRVHPTRPGNYRVWVTDFELAPLLGGKIPGALMAPEQFLTPHKETARADVFSLAALFLEMLTLSQKPDAHSDLPWAAWVSAHARDVRTALAKIYGDIPPAVLDVLAKALHPSPDERPPNAQALRTQLRRAMNEAGTWRERPEDEPEPPPVPESAQTPTEDPLDDTWRSGPQQQPTPLAVVSVPSLVEMDAPTVFNLPMLPSVAEPPPTELESTQTMHSSEFASYTSFATPSPEGLENTFVALPAMHAVAQQPVAQPSPEAAPSPPSGAFLAASQALLSARPPMVVRSAEPPRYAPAPVPRPEPPPLLQRKAVVVSAVALAVMFVGVFAWMALR